MIARPLNRPRPIPFAPPAPGARQPGPVPWSPPAQAIPFDGLDTPSSPPRPVSLSSALSRPTQVQAAPPPAPSRTPPQTPGARISPAPAAQAQADMATPPLHARYIGQGALSVRSSVTGRHYRFQGHGDSQHIDKHDVAMLRRIPDLIVR